MSNTKITNAKTFALTGKDGRVVEVNCYTKRGKNGFTHFAETNGEKSYIRYINRTWESFEYESVLRTLAGKIARGSEDKTCLLNSIEGLSKQAKADAEAWYVGIKKDYDGLCDTTKQHLANACPNIETKEQAEGIMVASKAFDVLFRLEEQEKAEGGQK